MAADYTDLRVGYTHVALDRSFMGVDPAVKAVLDTPDAEAMWMQPSGMLYPDNDIDMGDTAAQLVGWVAPGTIFLNAWAVGAVTTGASVTLRLPAYGSLIEVVLANAVAITTNDPPTELFAVPALLGAPVTNRRPLEVVIAAGTATETIKLAIEVASTALHWK